MKILGIDTSCDDTSVAIVENGNNVLSSVLSSSIDAHKDSSKKAFGGYTLCDR